MDISSHFKYYGVSGSYDSPDPTTFVTGIMNVLEFGFHF